MVPLLRLLFACLLLPTPAAATPCRLCPPDEAAAGEAESPVRPLRVEVEGAMAFGRVALSGAGGGAVEMAAGSPEAQTDGRLIDLGGARYSAVVRIEGQPGSRVRLHWPESVTLRSSGGGALVRMEAIRSDRRPILTLDASGRAQLDLGARLVVPPDAAGDYRGEITVDAEYD